LEKRTDNDKELERSVDYYFEQEEIMDNIHKIREDFKGRGLSWNRFRGDAIARVVAHYLEQHLPSNLKIVRLSWVEGCENEFDILITDKDAKPIGFTGAYPKERVHLLIEVKGSGVFYKRKEIKDILTKLFEKWKSKTEKPIFYLSFWEAAGHVEEVKRALGNDTAFILQVGNEEMNPTEWERFVENVNAVLKR